MEPLVSVMCVCYNHAKYLRQALDGVMNQKTDFPYEVLIHDDASTDGSQEIIREYMRRYPGRIRAILQTENQYSQGQKPSEFLYALARGKYYISLECDDFWQDEYKLQKQADALNRHPECVMCVHRTEFYDEKGVSTGQFFPQEQLPEGVLKQEMLVEYIANTCHFHISSRLIRANGYNALRQEPYWANRKMIGDVPMALCLSQQGPFYYLPDAMTGYRMNSNGSYSCRMNGDPVFFRERRAELQKMWLSFGECYPQYKQIALQKAEHYGIEEIQSRLSVNSHGEYREEYYLVHSDPYYKYYKKLPLHKKAKYWIRFYIPQSVTIWRFVKSLVKHEK